MTTPKKPRAVTVTVKAWALVDDRGNFDPCFLLPNRATAEEIRCAGEGIVRVTITTDDADDKPTKPKPKRKART